MAHEWYICETNRLKAKTALGTLKKYAASDELIKVPRPQQGKDMGGKFLVFLQVQAGSILKTEALKLLPKSKPVSKDEFEVEINKFKFFW